MHPQHRHCRAIQLSANICQEHLILKQDWSIQREIRENKELKKTKTKCVTGLRPFLHFPGLHVFTMTANPAHSSVFMCLWVCVQEESLWQRLGEVCDYIFFRLHTTKISTRNKVGVRYVTFWEYGVCRCVCAIGIIGGLAWGMQLPLSALFPARPSSLWPFLHTGHVIYSYGPQTPAI